MKRRRATGLKRLFDIGVTLVCGSICIPVAILVAVLVRVDLGSPVIFRQTRIGLNGRPFTLYKFRTMRDASTTFGGAAPDAERLTRFGKWLRATSLDELPELWNILTGDMSLVGPRPLLPEYLPLYSPRQASRHDVRPGLTGWAQVNGRNSLAWPDRLELDVWYVHNQSFALDVRILLMTIMKVVRSEGINAEGSATMEKFQG